MRILLLNRFAVSCAVCLQWALTAIKVCLLLPFLLNSALALQISKSFIQLGEHTDFELDICQCVQTGEVFRVTPTLFDGDYFWHMKHDASQSGIILLHFEWAFLI